MHVKYEVYVLSGFKLMTKGWSFFAQADTQTYKQEKL